MSDYFVLSFKHGTSGHRSRSCRLDGPPAVHSAEELHARSSPERAGAATSQEDRSVGLRRGGQAGGMDRDTAVAGARQEARTSDEG
jgi:hypothetical protein